MCPRHRTRAQPIRGVRIAFQIAVYALLLAHIGAWYLAGRQAVGSVSPNGVFYLAQTGLISPGVLLTGAGLVAVLVLGNAFCGWACHFGAAQDFAVWLMRRLRIEPLNLEVSARLRALLLVKLLVVNTALAWLAAGSLPRLFVNMGAPEPCYAIGTWLTVVLDVFVLAFLTTWVFGRRAFCRLLCPVILIMRAGNITARRRMRLTRDCIDCGACDRACPMGNRVSASLQETGAVAALDCVRCGRCRDACPVGAIGYRTA